MGSSNSSIYYVDRSTCVTQSVKGGLSDLDVTGSRPPGATIHTFIRYVRLVNRSNKLNLLPWPYVINKMLCAKYFIFLYKQKRPTINCNQ